MFRQIRDYLGRRPSSWESMEHLASGVYSAKDDPYSSHRLIADLILQHCQSGRLLDVGCAEAYITKTLQNVAGKPFRVTGVDVNPDSLQEAQSYCDEVVLTDIEKPLPIGGQFDAIVLADVIEHVRNPYQLVIQARELLAQDGVLLVSVPNVAHWTVRLSMLLGRFNYRPRGILDRTHLRFFTLQSLHALFDETGLRIVAQKCTPIPLPLLSPVFAPGRGLFLLHRLNYWLARFRPPLFGYQFIMVLRR